MREMNILIRYLRTQKSTEKKVSTFASVLMLLCVALVQVSVLSGAFVQQNEVQSTITGWGDSFVDTDKISEYYNVSISGGSVTLHQPNSSFDGQSWTKHGMVLDIGGTYDTTHAYSPTVIHDGGEYKMWYHGFDETNWRILYANSSDGSIWIKQGLALEAGGTNIAIGNPCVIKEDNEYKMWYCGSDGSNYRNFYANSTDGIVWQKQGIAIDIGGAGEDVDVITPTVIRETDGTYKMWYTGNLASRRIFYATSPGGIIWTKQGQVMGFGELYEENGVYGPTVIEHNSSYHMWYTGKSSTGETRILYATSPDGIGWTKHGLSLNYGQVAYEDDSVDNPCILIKEETVNLWYGGYVWLPSNRARILYATTPLNISWEKQGNLTSKFIELPTGYNWTSLNLTKTEPSAENNITVTILDNSTGIPIPGFINLTSTDVDISSIDEVTYSSIMLMATFSGNGSATPILHEWRVNWTWDGDTPIINHVEITYADIDEAINITANVTDNNAITEVTLCYKNVGDVFYTNISMTLISGNTASGNWSANIPAQMQIGSAYYYINATDGSLNSTHPWPNPFTTPHAIEIIDLTPPEIYHTFPAFLNTSDDVEITAQIIDNVGMDDARLHYYFDTTTGLTIAQNISMIDQGSGNYNQSIGIPDNAIALYYNILANDTSDNWNQTGELVLAVIDTIPVEIMDLTLGIPVTSGSFTIDAKVDDYIGIGTVYLNYLFLDSDFTYSWQNISMNVLGGGNYDYTIPVPEDAIWLNYNISASDTSNNWNETGIITLSVSDIINSDIFDLTIGTPSTGVNYVITSTVTDNINVSAVHLNYQFESFSWTSVWYNITMTFLGGNNYIYYVPVLDNATLFRYNMCASDNSSNWNSTSILVQAVNDVLVPIFSGLNSSNPATSSNFTITAQVMDNKELDEVYVMYYFSTLSGNTVIQNVSMNDLSGGNYDYTISVPENVLRLYYNISANDTSNNWNETGLQTLSINDTILPEILDLTTGTPSTGEDFMVTALLTDNINVSKVHLKYQFQNAGWTSDWFNISMADIGGNNYNLAIPILSNATLFRYYISASDNSSNWNSTSQVELAVNDSIAPEIEDITTGIPVTGGSFEIEINITDNIEVDYARIYVYYDLVGGNCTPQSIQLTSVSGDTYNANISIPLNATTLYYSAMANDTSNNWNVTDVINHDVNDDQAPTASYPSYTLFNMGSPFIFNASNSTDNIGIVNYSWMFTFDGIVIELYDSEAAFNFTNHGNYTITLTVIDANNNLDSTTSILQVVDRVFPISDPGTELIVLEGEAIIFDGTGSWDNVGIVNYTWIFSHNNTDIILFGASPTFTFWTNGTYVVSLRVEDASGNWNTSHFNVKVLNNPELDSKFSWWMPIILLIIIIVVTALLLRKLYPKINEFNGETDAPPSPNDTPVEESDIMRDLEERYSEGHISEEIYVMLKERYSGGE